MSWHRWTIKGPSRCSKINSSWMVMKAWLLWTPFSQWSNFNLYVFMNTWVIPFCVFGWCQADANNKAMSYKIQPTGLHPGEIYRLTKFISPYEQAGKSIMKRYFRIELMDPFLKYSSPNHKSCMYRWLIPLCVPGECPGRVHQCAGICLSQEKKIPIQTVP